MNMNKRPHTGRPDSRRPAYIEPRAPLEIRLEANALHIVAAGQADRFLPLRQLSRLMVSECVRMDLAVLCACARHGIPIIVRARDTGVVLRAVGHGTPVADLRQRLIDLSCNMAWQQHFRAWETANQQRIASLHRRRLRIPVPEPARVQPVQDWLHKQARHWASKRDADLCDRLLQENCLGRLQEELLRYGIDAASEVGLHDDIDLVARLARLLQFQLQPLRLGWLRRRHEWAERTNQAVQPVTHRQMVRLFERHHGRVERSTRDLVNRLHRWLVEMA